MFLKSWVTAWGAPAIMAAILAHSSAPALAQNTKATAPIVASSEKLVPPSVNTAATGTLA